MVKLSETTHPQDTMGSSHPGGHRWGLPDQPGDEDGDLVHPGTSGRAPVRGWSVSVLHVCNESRALEAAIRPATLPVTCVFAGRPHQPLKVT